MSANDEKKNAGGSACVSLLSGSCPECGGTMLSWSCCPYNAGHVVDGRLRMSEIGVNFVLGCDECSETVRVVRGDEIAIKLGALAELFHAAKSFVDANRSEHLCVRLNDKENYAVERMKAALVESR